MPARFAGTTDTMKGNTVTNLTKTERNRNMKVEERDRIRKQFQAEGLEMPPLMDPDVLGRGPGTGPSPRGADTGDEATKPSAAQVARETRAAIEEREEEAIPAIELAPVHEGGPVGVPTKKTGDVKPPKKAVVDAITAKKIGGRDVNLRGDMDPEADAEAIDKAEESMPGRVSDDAATRSTDTKDAKPTPRTGPTGSTSAAVPAGVDGSGDTTRKKGR